MAESTDSWYRSSPMRYVRFTVGSDMAETVVTNLGSSDEGVFQFVDVSRTPWHNSPP